MDDVCKQQKGAFMILDFHKILAIMKKNDGWTTCFLLQKPLLVP